MICIRPKRFTRKPVGAYNVNWGHPLATGITSLLLFNEAPGAVSSSVNSHSLYDPCAFATVSRENDSATAPAYVYNDVGSGVKFVATNDWMTHSRGSAAFFGTDRATILAIRRKTDSTLRASTLFGFDLVVDAARCGTHCPYSDGNIYFDFGGTGGSNRLIISGQSWGTTVDYLAFTSGKRGTEVWRNGARIGNQTTPVTRTNSASGQFQINRSNGLGAGSGDLQEIYFLATFKEEWSADMLNWWFAEPYAMVAPQSPRLSYFLPGTAAVSGARPVLAIIT